MHGHDDRSAAQTLDRIREGTGVLLRTATQRHSELKQAMDRGEFNAALGACASLQEKLTHLAEAQSALGRLADTNIIKVSDLEPGMKLTDIGVIERLDPCPFCEDEDCSNLTIHLEGGGHVALPGGAEVAVDGQA